VIDKENGHYGSCINAALPVAKGKYVKVLDADDWFDPQGFQYLIDTLQTLDNDMVITNYSERHVSGKRIYRYYSSSDRFDIRETPTSDTFVLPHHVAMQAVTYRTELLRRMNYRQSEGVHYSDGEWVLYPLFFVETWAFINADVYQYFLGRAEQSIASGVFKKNMAQFQVVKLHMLEYYFTFNRESLSKSRDAYLFDEVSNPFLFIYRSYLLWHSENDFVPDKMSSFDNAIRKINEGFYNHLSKETLRRWLPVRYIQYWRTHSKRLPLWVRFPMKILLVLLNETNFFLPKRIEDIICLCKKRV
jgi:glycosyltransferase involved in cell wall biosynthesis